jgi:hypothetical protein
VGKENRLDSNMHRTSKLTALPGLSLQDEYFLYHSFMMHPLGETVRQMDVRLFCIWIWKEVVIV